MNAASELGLFELLTARGKLGRDEIADALGLGARSTDLLLLGTTSMGLTTKSGGYYHNSPVIRQVRVAYLPASDHVESVR